MFKQKGVGALKVGTRPTASSSFTNNVSLNDNENVRNCLNENIYRVGGLDLERIGGGVSVGDVWMSGIERNRRAGGQRPQRVVRVRWVTHTHAHRHGGASSRHSLFKRGGLHVLD